MTKGDPRHANDELTKRTFELYAPNDANTSTSAINYIEAGKVYPITHNCYALLNLQHEFRMSQTNTTVEYYNNYCFFIPDRRYYYWKKRDNPNASGYSADQDYYAFYYRDPDNEDDIGYCPVFFAYGINLDAVLKRSDTPNAYDAQVSWKSTYKAYVSDSDPEDYYLYRVLADGSLEAVGIDEITIDADELANGITTISEENGVVKITSSASYPSVRVLELQDETNTRTVTYVVKGKPVDTDFSVVVSNEDEVVIPSLGEDTNVAISGIWRSTFNPATEYNNYRNRIYLSSTWTEDKPLEQLYAEEGDIFELNRTDAAGNVSLIGTLTVNTKALNDDGDKYNYSYTLVVGSETTTGTWQSDLGDYSKVLDEEGNQPSILDCFTENVNSPAGPYTYQMTKKREGADDKLSNVLTFTPVSSAVDVNLVSYTEEDVAADTDHSLTPNTVIAKLNVKRSMNVRRYEILRSYDQQSWDVVASIDRKGGSYDYKITTLNTSGELSRDAGSVAMESASANVEIQVPYIPYVEHGAQAAPKFCVRVVTATEDVETDNEWGTPRSNGVSMPWVDATTTGLCRVELTDGSIGFVKVWNNYTPSFPSSTTTYSGGVYNVWRTIDSTEELIVKENEITEASYVHPGSPNFQSYVSLDQSSWALSHCDVISRLDNLMTTDEAITATYRVRHYVKSEGEHQTVLKTVEPAKYVVTEDIITVTANGQSPTDVMLIPQDDHEKTKYYNLQGMYLGTDESILTSGLYLKVQGSTVSKVLK
ncbi:MAG: hypothetical protein LIP02_03680 [Bacteroidales bacterium]|nr:hypothetical protein [Bacteroidales bacterium]